MRESMPPLEGTGFPGSAGGSGRRPQPMYPGGRKVSGGPLPSEPRLRERRTNRRGCERAGIVSTTEEDGAQQQRAAEEPASRSVSRQTAQRRSSASRRLLFQNEPKRLVVTKFQQSPTALL